MATLSVVATPIGNLEDITLRALRALKEVDVIVCEDTRVTKKLLSRYEIHTPTLSYHARSGQTKIDKIVGLLMEGNNLALVSDAGTPLISDPGTALVSAVRERLGGAVAVVAVPGPSAFTAALSIAGVPASTFLFLGFLPHKKGRETLFRDIAESARTVVFYESPHRIRKTLAALGRVVPERGIVLCRELTKFHEETLTGTAGELLGRLAVHSQKQRGEFVVIVAP